MLNTAQTGNKSIFFLPPPSQTSACPAVRDDHKKVWMGCELSAGLRLQGSPAEKLRDALKRPLTGPAKTRYSVPVSADLCCPLRGPLFKPITSEEHSISPARAAKSISFNPAQSQSLECNCGSHSESSQGPQKNK